MAHRVLSELPLDEDESMNELYHLCECLEGVVAGLPALALQEQFHVVEHLRALLVQQMPWLCVNITVLSLVAHVAEFDASLVRIMLSENETIGPFIASLLRMEYEDLDFFPLNEVLHLVAHLCKGAESATLVVLLDCGLLAVAVKRALQLSDRVDEEVLAKFKEALRQCVERHSRGKWVKCWTDMGALDLLR